MGKSLTLDELIRAASLGYPDGMLEENYDFENHRPVSRDQTSDGLARFLVVELCETFDEDAVDWQQVETAKKALRMAQRDLSGVYESVCERLPEPSVAVPTELLEFVKEIADLDKDSEGEKAKTDGWENDDAWEKLHELISAARSLLGLPDTKK